MKDFGELDLANNHHHHISKHIDPNDKLYTAQCDIDLMKYVECTDKSFSNQYHHLSIWCFKTVVEDIIDLDVMTII